MQAKLALLGTFCFGLAVFSSLKASDTSLVKNVNFLPLTISIACDASTPGEDQVQYERAQRARPEVRVQECADKRRTIDGVIPHTADVEYSYLFHIWLVGVTLSDRDASVLKILIANNVGRLMLIGAKRKILSISQIGGPRSNNKIYINADSQKDAHNMMLLLTGP